MTPAPEKGHPEPVDCLGLTGERSFAAIRANAFARPQSAEVVNGLLGGGQKNVHQPWTLALLFRQKYNFYNGSAYLSPTSGVLNATHQTPALRLTSTMLPL